MKTNSESTECFPCNMGPFKKKQIPRSTATLHDFFNPATAPLENRKSNTLAAPARTKFKGTRSEGAVSAQDIIVIDSDSDDAPGVSQIQGVQGTKRRRLSGSSDEVEFVDQVQPSKNTTQASKRSTKPGSKDNLHKVSTKNPFTPDKVVSAESTSVLTSNTASCPPELLFPSFGNPSLLFPTTAHPPLSAASSTPLSFGSPTLLSSTDDQILACPSQVPDVQNFIPNGDLSKIDFEFSTNILDDDWGMGDDEVPLEHLVDDEGDDVDDLTISSPLDSSGPVPSCVSGSANISQTDMKAGPSDCLNSTAEGTTSNPFRPLISLSTPQVHGPLRLMSCDGKTKDSASNAFSVLMSSHKENEAWREASVVEDRNFHPSKSNGGRRKAPFYKVLQGMPIAVDAFRYGTIPSVTAYFLTHAHSDHYTNLSSNWKSGPIYCSECTANLIIHMLAVDRKWVHPLPMDVPTVIPNTSGVTVTLIEANHCPGSCLFYFEGPQTVNAGDSAFKSLFVGSSKTFRYLHCGDFRASPRHIQHPAVKGKRIDHVYLDTTYLDSKYTFPPQPLVISACADLAQRISSGYSTGHNTPTMDSWMIPNGDSSRDKAKRNKILMVIGTYSIGKERIVKAVAHALQSKVYCDARKRAILLCQADPELDALLTSDPLVARVHLVPLGVITSDKLKTYVERFKGHFTKVVGFRPTGWTYSPPVGTDQLPPVSSIISPSNYKSFTYANLHPARSSTPSLQLFPVPYSEHSSFFELTCFAMSFNWGKMIATVNVGSESSRGRMAKWVAKWEAERKKRGKDILVAPRDPDYW